MLQTQLKTSSTALPSEDDRLVSLWIEWTADPVRFVTDVFGCAPEKWQADALRAIAERDRVAIRSGHGVGKSAFLAWVILWFLVTHPGAKVPCTAPTAHQLEDVLWGELGKWHRRMPDFLKGQIEVKGGRITLTGSSESLAVARTARKENPEAFQGFHGDNLLFVVDEASGVEDIIFEVGQGAMSTRGAKAIMAGNPTRTSGYFYDAFHSDRERWLCIKVACADSTQVDPGYALEMADKYGIDSTIYAVRVLGEFPKDEDDVIIPLHLLESAVHRGVDQYGPMMWGVDVATFGDDRSALCKRFGNHQLGRTKTWQKKDPMQTAGIIKAEYDAAPIHHKPQRIVVDAIGVGAGVAPRLKEMGLPAIGINVGESAAEKDTYLRLRDELWFRAKDWLQDRKCCLEDDQELIGELSSVKYAITPSGKIKVESKDDMKKRGRRSPDLADAFCLTFAYGAEPRMNQRQGYAASDYDEFDSHLPMVADSNYDEFGGY